MGLSHVDEKGAARMVDVGDKPTTQRRALARAFVRLAPATLEMIAEGKAPKGDVFAVSRVAGIMAAKKTPELIPLCHPLPLSSVKVDLSPTLEGVEILAEASTSAQTGVEMEAMVAAASAALALYDMIKGVEKDAFISEVCLLEKSGGKSGTYQRS